MDVAKKWAAVVVAITGAVAGSQVAHPYDQILMTIGAIAAAFVKSPSQS